MRTSFFRHGAQALQAIPASGRYQVAAPAFFIAMAADGASPGKAQAMSAVSYGKLQRFMACTFRQVPDRADALS